MLASLRNPQSLLRRLRFTELQLLLVPSALMLLGTLIVILVPQGTMSWTWRDIWMALVFIGLLVATHIWLNYRGRRSDQLLIPVIASLSALGLILIQRLEPSLVRISSFYHGIANKQLVWVILGFVVMWAVVAFLQMRWLRQYKYTWVILGFLLVMTTTVFGVERNGAKLWLSFGIFNFQPSEILKIITVIFLAAYLDEKRDLISAEYRLWRLKVPPLPYLAPMVMMWGLSLLILVGQKDLGGALLFFGIFLGMLYVVTGRSSYVCVGLVFFAIGAVASYFVFSHVAVRVDAWLDPWGHGLDEAYQIVQALFSFANGGVLGTGLGLGHPAYIPAVYTDFVFAAIGEELGLAGTLAVVALYLVLVYRAFHIAVTSRDGFHQLLAVGFGTVLGLQSLIIIAGDIKLIPLTGITLPFVSYGGSSILANFLIIGLLLRISAIEGERASR
jgi:cell division protein FtsW (lipid II flippase)